MDEDFQELDYRELELSVKQDDLEIIDQVLLADIARSWERLGNVAHLYAGPWKAGLTSQKLCVTVLLAIVC